MVTRTDCGPLTDDPVEGRRLAATTSLSEFCVDWTDGTPGKTSAIHPQSGNPAKSSE